MSFLMLLVATGLVGGFFSGLLGLGGAIIMVPMLLFIPPMFGFPALDMKVVSSISIVQVAFASLSAVLVHARNNFVSRKLVLFMGVSGAVASFAGGFYSKQVPANTLLLIFAIISSLAAVMMFIPRKEMESGVPADEIGFNRPLAVLIALAVGTVGGLIGAPGAFIYVPLLMYVLGIPTRITLGSTLAIVLIGSLSGMIGKLVTYQVPLGFSVALVLGAIPGARWGGAVSKRLNVKSLRWLVTLVVVASTLKVWAQVLGM